MRRIKARHAGGALMAVVALAAASSTYAAGDTTEPTGDTEASEGTEAAAGTDAAGRHRGDAGGGGTIAFSYGNESAGIYPIVANPARIEAEARGYEFLEGSANGDCDVQVQDVENFVAQEVDAIVVLPLCGPEPLDPGARRGRCRRYHRGRLLDRGARRRRSDRLPERRRRRGRGGRGDPLDQRGLHRRPGELHLGAVHLRPVRHARAPTGPTRSGPRSSRRPASSRSRPSRSTRRPASRPPRRSCSRSPTSPW